MHLLVIRPELVQRVIALHHVNIFAQMYSWSQNGLRYSVFV